MFKQPIFFIAPDINFALGLIGHADEYHIITLYDHPIIPLLKADGISVFCLEHHGETAVANNSGSILAHPHVASYIKQHSPQLTPAIMVFKPSPKVDHLAQQNGYLLLANPAFLNRKLEDKLLMPQLLFQNPHIPLVPSTIITFSEIPPANLAYPFVIQSSRGWAGTSTWVINTPDELAALQLGLSGRQVKISHYISGKTYTLNGCVTQEDILVSQPALQINAPHPDFSPNPAATCGRQWPAVGLSSQQTTQSMEIGKAVGAYLQTLNYKGFFGIDLIVDSQTGETFLLEINPRLTASESFFSQLQANAGLIPFIVAHVATFLNQALSFDNQPEVPLIGTQLILRNNQPDEIHLQSALAPGFYSFKDQLLDMEHYSYQISSQDPGLLIRTPGTQKPIAPHSELLRLESNQQLTDYQGQLPKSLIDQLIGIKQQLLHP